jgi:transketolase
MHVTDVRTAQALGFADLPRLMSLMAGDEKHDFASASTLGVLWVLYDQVLNVSPATADAEDRDRFFLSKGHGPMAYYAVLAAKGFIDQAALAGYGSFDSALGHHPDRNLLRGVEISSGSLGHGLPLAVGAALGLRARKLDQSRVFVLIGDGELAEGSNHEAIELAARAGLDRLNCVVVDNGTATYGWPGGIDTRFATEGWSTAVADGRDHQALLAAFSQQHHRRPHAVVAVV